MAEMHRRHLGLGIFLALSFLVVLALIFSPLYGEGRNGLKFADDLFNTLSKGSSYFIPKLLEGNKKFTGENFSVGIKTDNPEEAEALLKQLNTAGLKAGIAEGALQIEGNLGRMLETVLKDADAMYHNQGAKVSQAYDMDEKDVMKNWWQVLNKAGKELAKQEKAGQAVFVSDVNKKAVETAYNFYGVEGQKVTERMGLMTFLLVFYVAYTMWWGFAVFYLFEGLGLTMTKAKVKKEV